MAAVPDRGRAVEVEPLASRDSQLAEDLFTAYSRRIYAYCLSQLRSPEEAEDAVQATYLNACRSLMRGFEPEAAQAWLFKVAQNVCLTRRRNRSRRARLELAQDLTAVEEIVPAPAAGDELVGLEEALASLPEQQRRAFLLREWQGLSYREVADELGVSQSAVETLIFRARRSLAAALAPPEPTRPRLMHGFDVGSLLAGLKSAMANGLNGGLATGAAIAASTTVIAAPPVGGVLEAKPAAGPLVVAAAKSLPAKPASPPALADRLSFSAPAGGGAQVFRGVGKGPGFGKFGARGRGRGHGKEHGRPSWAGSGGPPSHANAGGHGGGRGHARP